MKINRRNFLKSTIFTSLYFAGFGSPLLGSNKNKKNLIVIMLRGGMDGLCAIPVKNDKRFEKLRSKINLDRTLTLTNDFDLHPALDDFKRLWDKNLAAAVHATSIPYTGRSHFDGQNLMESGGNVPYQIKTGWLGRGMKLANLKGDGLALALPMPLLIRGVPMNDNYYPVKGTIPRAEILDEIKRSYIEHNEELLNDTLEIIKKREFDAYSSRDNFDLALNAGKKLSKPNGPRVAVFEVDGFDTHAAQGATNGAHADCLHEFDNILKGLKQSMNSETFKNSLIVTLTEFGRTIKQNSSNGTEHGYASAVLMAGGLVKKAQVYSDWPGLKRKELFEGRDLNSTIDARSIYASAMSTVFDLDFKRIQKEVFWGEKLENLSDKLFS
tara:strand:- start:204 stop:1352 length:1149 start_codon:yes stop_codon:yes gene_type:complete